MFCFHADFSCCVDIARLGGGWIMTEFGAAEDRKGDLYALHKSMQQADKHLQSWMYWQFKYYQDITTCTPTGESLYNEDGSIVDHKLRILSRSYPQAVAGSIESYHFEEVLGTFSMKYSLLADVSSGSAETEIYINRDMYYPHGAHVTVSAGETSLDGVLTTACAHLNNIVTLTQTAASTANVTVTVKPCVPLLGACNCR
jgi:endoglycosylceramidase